MIVATGANGFIGSRIVVRFLKMGRTDVAAIIHLGTCSDTMQTDDQSAMSSNVQYAQALWEWCTVAGCPLVYASSAATYEYGSAGFDDEVEPEYYWPLNLYAQSKHQFDHWALKQTTEPPRWDDIKYFNVSGPNEYHKDRMASVVYFFYHQIRETGTFKLFKSYRPGFEYGGRLHDFVCVDDAVDATLHMLDTAPSQFAPNVLCNVGTGAARTFVGLACAVFLAVGREPNNQCIPMPKGLRQRYQYLTQATTKKLRRASFMRPLPSVEDGVRDHVQDYLVKAQFAA